MHDVDLRFELTLQDLRYIVGTGLGYGGTQRDLMLNLALPFGVLAIVLLQDFEREPDLFSFVPLIFFMLGIPLLLEFAARALKRGRGAKRTPVIWLRASEQSVELADGEESAEYPWHRIRSIRWTDQMAVMQIDDPKDRKDAEQIHLRRRVIPETQAWLVQSEDGKYIHIPRRVIPDTQASFLRSHVRCNLDGEDLEKRRRFRRDLLRLVIAALALRVLTAYFPI